MQKSVLWRKEARIVMMLANVLEVTPVRALKLFYSTKIHQLLIDERSGMQLWSDGDIVDSLLVELREQ